ncbi:MAG: hypothetical protein ACI8WM_002863 [Burkholderiaceae bacterium]|jgi:hypothetical protein
MSAESKTKCNTLMYCVRHWLFLAIDELFEALVHFKGEGNNFLTPTHYAAIF